MGLFDTLINAPSKVCALDLVFAYEPFDYSIYELVSARAAQRGQGGVHFPLDFE